MDGGTDASPGDTEIVIPGCDVDKDPRDALCQLDDAIGVFVSPRGDDAAPGTKTHPFRTAGHALEALGSHTRIYLCEGPHEGSLLVRRRLGIYGGFTCDDWHFSGTPSVLAAPAGAVALTVDKNVAITLVQDLDLRAGEANKAGASSVAAFLNDSAQVTMTRVKLSAKDGQTGASAVGAPASNYAASVTGSTPSSSIGSSAATTCTCPRYGQSRGGGSAKCGDGGGETGSSTPPVASPSGSGGAISGSGCNIGGPGTQGDVRAGGVRAVSPGTFDPALGWMTSSGGPGEDGNPGQGGGGASCKVGTSICAGTGGGCGGCGGAGGVGGPGGGSSIALLVYKTTVSLRASTLVAMSGGAGGQGGTGQTGQEGGAAGATTCGGCLGGKGGSGGAGGGGAGGSGGVSAGIVYASSSAPLFDDAPIGAAAEDPRITLGMGGSRGPAGLGGAAAAGGVAGKGGETGLEGKRAAVIEVR